MTIKELKDELNKYDEGSLVLLSLKSDFYMAPKLNSLNGEEEYTYVKLNDVFKINALESSNGILKLIVNT